MKKIDTLVQDICWYDDRALTGGKWGKRRGYREYLNHIQVAGLRIADIGCGYGEFLSICSDEGAKSCVGIDFSEKTLEKAWQTSGSYCSVFLKKEMAKTELKEGSFDLVAAIGSIEHASSFAYLMDTIKEIYRITKPGGTAFIVVPNSKFPMAGTEQPNEFLFDKKEWGELFTSCGFTINSIHKDFLRCYKHPLVPLRLAFSILPLEYTYQFCFVMTKPDEYNA